MIEVNAYNIAIVSVILLLILWYLFLIIFDGIYFLRGKNNNFIKNIKKDSDLQHNFNNLANENELKEEDYPIVLNNKIESIDLDNDSSDWGTYLKDIEEQQNHIERSNGLKDLLGDIEISSDRDSS